MAKWAELGWLLSDLPHGGTEFQKLFLQSIVRREFYTAEALRLLDFILCEPSSLKTEMCQQHRHIQYSVFIFVGFPCLHLLP